MTDSQQLPQGEKEKISEIIKKCDSLKEGNPVRYHLKSKIDELNNSQPYRKINFEDRCKNKTHKTILMVGETGTGKTTLINTMVNFILRVQIKDKVWFEITDDQSDRTSAHSQTSDVTVYGVYLQEASVDLTIIDTPGYGHTSGFELDKQIAMNLLSLFRFESSVYELDAVCLVVKATQNRLSPGQQYIFDAVQSLFGKDIAENIVILLTHSDGYPPKDALTAVKEAKIKCAVNEKNQPVYFLFNNRQEETFDEEYQTIQEQSWDLSFRGTTNFFKFLDKIKPKNLQMTQDVLKKRKQLEANISNLQSRVQEMEKKKKTLKQTQEALEKNKKLVKDNKNFMFEVEETYKEKIPINPELWLLTKEAMCCPICEENCHYPGCWWVKDLSWCSVMKNDHCTVCTNKCHSNKHVKEDKIYETKIKKVQRTFEDLMKLYNAKIGESESVVKKLEEELQKLDNEKKKLVNEAFHCIESLEMIALKSDSLFTLLHIDFLIEKLKEINEPEKAKVLEKIRKSAETNNGGMRILKYMMNMK